MRENDMTSTKVVQIEDPIQQKKEILPINSVRSLFYINKRKNVRIFSPSVSSQR